jgi:hypothetical protein
MAKQDVVIEVDIQGTQKVESMRTQMRKLREELAQLPEGTAEFNRVQRQLGELKDRVDDLGKSVNTVSGAPLERLNNSFSMIGSSIMSLDFDNALTGLNGMSAAIGDVKAKDIGTVLKNAATALGNLGKALLTNPIFLIGGAIALIIMNFEKLISIFPSVEKGLTGIASSEREAAAAAESRAEASKKSYENIDKQTNILKLQGKTEREILDFKLKALKISIDDRKNQLVIQQEQAKIQVETAKRNKVILEGILQFITSPLQVLVGTLDIIGKTFGQQWDLRGRMNSAIGNLIINPVEQEKELNDAIEKNKDALLTMENDYAGLQLSIKAMNEKAAQDKLIANENAKRNEDDDLKKIESKTATRITDEKKELQLSFDAARAAAQSKALMEIAIEEDKRRKIYEGEKALQESKYELAKAAIDGMMSLNDLLTTAGILNAEQSFKVGKALSMAQATITAIEGTMAAYSTANKSPITAVFPGYPFVMAGVAAAAGAANIAKIAATKFNKSGGSQPAPTAPSGGGGGGMGGSTNAPALDLSFINQQTNKPQPLQAYVLATNVSSAQEANEKIKDQSRIIK